MKKFRVLSLILALFLVFSMLPMSVMAEGAENETVNDDPYAIDSVAEFLALSGSGAYYLADDLDFSKKEITTPYLVESFNGVLDGRGHTIFGFELNATDAETVGVFGTLGTDAVVSNLTVGTATAPIKATVSASGALNFGFLAGKAEGTALVADVTVYSAEQSTVTAAGTLAVGGILGCGVATDLSKCVFNGTLTVNGGTTGGIGGIVGMLGNAEDAKVNSLLTKCVNNATITATTEVKVAGIVGSAASTVQIMECANNGTATVGILGENTTTSLKALTVIYNCSTTSGNIYGVDKVDNSYGKRIYIAGCTGSENTPEAGADGAGTNYYDYVTVIDEASDFDKFVVAEGKTLPEYHREGFYRLNGKIDFSDVSKTHSVVEYFDGVLDGNGNTIENLTFATNADGDVGFVEHPAIVSDTTVLNLNMGTQTKPMNMPAVKKGNAGALFGGVAVVESDVDKPAYGITVYGVDIYFNVGNHTSGSTRLERIGGIIGYASSSYTIVDSNIHGKVTTVDKEAVNLAAGFVATDVSVGKSLILGCNNYTDISMSGSSSKRFVAGGFIAESGSTGTVLYNCANFGDIQTNHSVSGSGAGGFFGKINKSATVSNCANFGATSGDRSASVSIVTNGGTINIVGFEDYGTVGTVGADRYIYSLGSATVNLCDVEAGSAISMVNGASIRIDSVKGIRFTSKVSEKAIESLERIYGDDAVVSYGTIITPSEFIHNESGAGEFTIDALDAFGESLGTLGGDKAYVQIDSTDKWFDNKNGHIAGSIIGIDEELYDIKFSGRAYISVTVGRVPVFTLYSDYTVENNSRSITEVATSALDDVIYKNGDNFYAKDKEGNLVRATAEQISEYATVTGNTVEIGDTTYETYSCYTGGENGQLASIKAILGKQ